MATSVTKTSSTTLLDLPQELIVDIYKLLFDDYAYVPTIVMTNGLHRISYVGSRLPLSHLMISRGLQDAIGEALAGQIDLHFQISSRVTWGETERCIEELTSRTSLPKFLRVALLKITKVGVYSVYGGVDMVHLAELLPAMKYFDVYRMAIEEAAAFIELHAAVQLKPTEEELKIQTLRILRGSRHNHSISRSIHWPCAVQGLFRCQKIVLHVKVFNFEIDSLVMPHLQPGWSVTQLDNGTELVSLNKKRITRVNNVLYRYSSIIGTRRKSRLRFPRLVLERMSENRGERRAKGLWASELWMWKFRFVNRWSTGRSSMSPGAFTPSQSRRRRQTVNAKVLVYLAYFLCRNTKTEYGTANLQPRYRGIQLPHIIQIRIISPLNLLLIFHYIIRPAPYIHRLHPHSLRPTKIVRMRSYCDALIGS
jgi:hypothetical protein